MIRSNVIFLVIFLFVCTSCSKKLFVNHTLGQYESLNLDVENFIKIETPNNKPFTVTTNEGKLVKLNQNDYKIIIIDSLRKHDPIKITINQGKKEKVLSFYAEKTPTPQFYFITENGEKGDQYNVPFTKFRKISNLFVGLNWSQHDFSSAIKSMDIIRIDRYKNSSKISSDGKMQRSSRIIQKAEDGDIYIFTNIIVDVKYSNFTETIRIKDHVVNITY